MRNSGPRTIYEMEWTALAASVCHDGVAKPVKKEPSAVSITMVGLDIAESVFQVHAVDGTGTTSHPGFAFGPILAGQTADDAGERPARPGHRIWSDRSEGDPADRQEKTGAARQWPVAVAPVRAPPHPVQVSGK